jgi:hypothetical protein
VAIVWHFFLAGVVLFVAGNDSSGAFELVRRRYQAYENVRGVRRVAPLGCRQRRRILHHEMQLSRTRQFLLRHDELSYA